MLIPLDYYRILGVPVGVSSEQLAQAYQDRSLQLPRSEYSDQAIAARKQLLEEAYAVLSDPQRRTDYDANFFKPLQEPSPSADLPASDNKQQQAESGTAWLDIPSEQFVGALLILQELGEYEHVLKFAPMALESNDSDTDVSMPGSSREDIVLTLVLSCLELGRERWQQGEYEQAAAAGQMGRELLQKEGLFSNLRSEIDADLDKLRPYRILELLALDTEHRDRPQGLQLLKEMLADRHGIDGSGKDGSGLSVDDFLHFIQQLRSHLTIIEQQEIFEIEAKRPSAVAAYLAVYALVARGFAYHQPVFIVRAQEMLDHLRRRQDVYLEYAVCAMLLGQTREANLVLERSQEREPLDFIRQHSQGDPDLLEGLCLYGERWLQTEVFAHFKDLANQEASLQDYFTDEKVQTYLEKLAEEKQLPSLAIDQAVTAPISHHDENDLDQHSALRATARDREQEYQLGGTATLTATVPRAAHASLDRVDTAERDLDSSRRFASVLPYSLQQDAQRRQRRDARLIPRHGVDGAPSDSPHPSFVAGIKRLHQKKASFKFPLAVKLLLLLGSIGLLGFGVASFVRSFSNVSRETEPELQLGLNRAPIAIPSPVVEPEPVAVELTNEAAQRVIQSWLLAKSQAFGSDYQLDRLSQILAPNLLALWRNRAEAFANNNTYREYQHSVNVRSVSLDPQNPDRASVEAVVKEAAQHYQNGEMLQQMSYADELLVRYDLIRQQEQWLVENITVL